MTLEELILASSSLSEAEKQQLLQRLSGDVDQADEAEDEGVDAIEEEEEFENDAIESSFTDAPTSIKTKQPSLLGFHVHGLWATVILDCVWMLIEFMTGGLINLLVFVIFGATSYIVFTKQRLLGDSQAIALLKAVCLGFIAGFPTSFVGLFLFGACQVLNRVIPATEKFSVKLATAETIGLGNFMAEFKQLETLVAQSVAAIDPNAVEKDLWKNSKFIKKQGLISKDLFVLLNATRKIRNGVVHGSAAASPTTFTFNDLQLLRKCKIEAEKALKR